MPLRIILSFIFQCFLLQPTWFDQVLSESYKICLCNYWTAPINCKTRLQYSSSDTANKTKFYSLISCLLFNFIRDGFKNKKCQINGNFWGGGCTPSPCSELWKFKGVLNALNIKIWRDCSLFMWTPECFAGYTGTRRKLHKSRRI